VNELSGLAASRKHPGILYAHNDSGDTPRVFAMDEKGTVVSEIRLDGASSWDWEDISVGPCPAGSCLYVADTGDGSNARDHYTIYRLPEPAALPSGGVTVSSFERFHFVYPDDGGRHNSEALMVHPVSGRMFVIIKMGGRPSLYEMPQPLVPDERKTLRHLGVLALPAADSIVTGAALHPCRNRMLVRTVDGLYELSAPGTATEALLTATPVKVPFAAQEPQGEAVTYGLDGRRYLTSSETGDEPQPVNIVTCQRAAD
jgi:hypothetical protein